MIHFEKALRSPDSALHEVISSLNQNAFGNPAWRKMAFAVCRLGMPIGTGKLRRVIGLNHISWLPFPCRTK